MKTKFFKRLISLTLSIIMALSMIIVSGVTTSAGGTGEQQHLPGLYIPVPKYLTVAVMQ